MHDIQIWLYRRILSLYDEFRALSNLTQSRKAISRFVTANKWLWGYEPFVHLMRRSYTKQEPTVVTKL